MRKIALYPGTFDPVTLGHLDIIRRGLRLFDSVVVTVAGNLGKKSLFNAQERKSLVEASVKGLKGVSVITHEGLTVDLAQEIGAVAILRGLRSMTDFDDEYQMAAMNARMQPDVETVFLSARADHAATASRLIKEVAKGGGAVDLFVPKPVVIPLTERLKQLK
ncbi:MAG: pantetheine-phosphate adenylyltransferase [Magnetococcales bacterium]|nr:pantetheine-phosphate adenylyltransferase [Magnetococcales bacterium]